MCVKEPGPRLSVLPGEHVPYPPVCETHLFAPKGASKVGVRFCTWVRENVVLLTPEYLETMVMLGVYPTHGCDLYKGGYGRCGRCRVWWRRDPISRGEGTRSSGHNGTQSPGRKGGGPGRTRDESSVKLWEHGTWGKAQNGAKLASV